MCGYLQQARAGFLEAICPKLAMLQYRRRGRKLKVLGVASDGGKEPSGCHTKTEVLVSAACAKLDGVEQQIGGSQLVDAHQSRYGEGE